MSKGQKGGDEMDMAVQQTEQEQTTAAEAVSYTHLDVYKRQAL